MTLRWRTPSKNLVTASAFARPGAMETIAEAPRLSGPSLLMTLRQGIDWLRKAGLRPLFPTRSRRLHVTETVQLGEKRFLSIVAVDGVDYLVGGGTTNVALLTRLGAAAPAQTAFDRAIDDAWRQGGAAL